MAVSKQKVFNILTIVMAILQTLTSIFHPQASQTSGVEQVVRSVTE